MGSTFVAVFFGLEADSTTVRSGRALAGVGSSEMGLRREKVFAARTSMVAHSR
jgi:hypothetical protein